jgi:hypothetical protein
VRARTRFPNSSLSDLLSMVFDARSLAQINRLKNGRDGRHPHALPWMWVRAGQPGRAVYRESTAKDQSALRMRIRDIARSRPRFGCPRIHIMLRREGWRVNHKRVHRLSRLEGLQVRMRERRRRRLSLHRGAAPRPVRVDERWSMDFVHDQLIDGRSLRSRRYGDDSNDSANKLSM